MGPIARESATITSLAGNALLFGGLGGAAPSYAQILSDTWTWNGGAWLELPGAGPPRSCATMASLQETVVLFGGVNQLSTFTPDTWIWNGSAWAQTQVAGPPMRMFGMMAALNDTVVLFGGEGDGQDEAGTMPLALSDTWIWDGSAWTELSVEGPSPRSRAVMGAL